MGVPRFTRPKTPATDSPSPYLYVANCGPAVGLSYDTIASVFNTFGEVKGIYAADESGTRVIVSYSEANSAQQALTALNGKSCADLGGRSLHIRYSVIQPNCEAESQQVNEHIPVSLLDSEVNIPGLYLVHDFLSPQEEKELLAAVDERPWISLSKRRVQHYGYEFCYGTRNVDTKLHLGKLPSFVSSVLERISLFPGLNSSTSILLDQLTVNEYPPGVGLSPHIDTHSAFEGLIFSLSLAGPCIMEFRRYLDGSWVPDAASSAYTKVENVDNCSNLVRRSLYLPPRSILLLSGEARYAWQHYIPHHKIDMVNQSVIRRGARRVSFTFRKSCQEKLCNLLQSSPLLERHDILYIKGRDNQHFSYRLLAQRMSSGSGAIGKYMFNATFKGSPSICWLYNPSTLHITISQLFIWLKILHFMQKQRIWKCINPV